jgi:type II secretory pathway component PulF
MEYTQELVSKMIKTGEIRLSLAEGMTKDSEEVVNEVVNSMNDLARLLEANPLFLEEEDVLEEYGTYSVEFLPED